MTDLPPNLSDDEMGELKASIMAELGAISPELPESARGLLDCISTRNWVLEWGLPHGLGATLGLEPEVTRVLALSNAFGLAYVRYADDRIDGDEPRCAAGLGPVLHHLWIAQYARLLGASGQGPPVAGVAAHPDRSTAIRFWACFDEYMREWLRAALRVRQGPRSTFRSFTEKDYLQLSWRGAPLKIGCAAACLLAGREGDLPHLTSAVDQCMAALVLVDDEFDWAEDLAAGRYNTFVACCSDLPQSAEHREANHRAVLKEVYTGDAARAYFDAVRQRLRMARGSVQAFGCQWLSAFIDWYESEVTACGAWLEREAHARLLAVVASARASQAPAHPLGGR
jgi:hypothetical protein